MEAQIKLFRIFGIQIGLHYSWLLIALLVALSLAGQFSATNPQWGATVIWSVSILTAILFFVTIVLHELSHAAIAKMRGLPVKSITLFALGGVAQIEKEASDPKTEFWMGIAGPITSALIGSLCVGLAAVFGWTPAARHQSPQLAMLVWLGIINISLAVFNMIPGFPLDCLVDNRRRYPRDPDSGAHGPGLCLPFHHRWADSLFQRSGFRRTVADFHRLVSTGRRTIQLPAG